MNLFEEKCVYTYENRQVKIQAAINQGMFSFVTYAQSDVQWQK